MSYVNSTANFVSDAAGTSYTPPFLPAHDSDDVIFCCVSQDVGGTNITASGWTNIGTQADSSGGGCRQGWLYKVAASSNETVPTFAGGNHNWTCHIIVVCNVDQTTPIDAYLRTDWTTGTKTLASGTPTTTTNNCLILYSWASTGTNYLLGAASEMIQDGKISNTVVSIAGHRNQVTAGVCPTVTCLNEVTTKTGNSWVIAVRDKSVGGAGGVDIDARPVLTTLRWNGTYDPPATSAPNTVSGLTAIAGVNMGTAVATSASGSLVTLPWGNCTSQSTTDAANTWGGFFDTFTSTYNLAGQIVAVSYRLNGIGAAVGAKGYILVFVDSSNNWVAYTIQVKAIANSADTFTSHIAVGNATALASSAGAIDWTVIKKVGYFVHKVTTAATIVSWKPLIATNGCVLLGGCALKPITPTALDNIYDGWGQVQKAASANGSGQGLNRQNLQIGDGSTPTYVNFNACSYELPLSTDLLWNCGVNSAPFTIYAGASDTYLFTACVLATNVRQNFTIHASSSTSATMTWAGASIIGWDVIGKSGMPAFDGATFSGNYTITLNGQGLSGCKVLSARGTTACTTTNLGTISGTTFTSVGTGHAITITTAGTYSFSANTFTGYASSSGSTGNEAIYNNSGGAVTINIVGGGSVPSIRNGSGASTTVNNAATLTLTGLVSGSDIAILSAGTSTERVNVDANAGTTYAFGYSYVAGDHVDICLYKSGYTPFAIRNYLLSASNVSLPVAQTVDRAYA